MTLWDEEPAKAIVAPRPCLPGRLPSEFSLLPILMEKAAHPRGQRQALSDTLSCSAKWLQSDVDAWSLCYIVIWHLLSRCHPAGKGTQDRSSRQQDRSSRHLFCSCFFVCERNKLSAVFPGLRIRHTDTQPRPSTAPWGRFQGTRTELWGAQKTYSL